MNARQRRVARRAGSINRKFIPRLALTPAQQSALLACLQPAAPQVSRFFISQERPAENTPAAWEALPWVEIGSGAQVSK